MSRESPSLDDLYGSGAEDAAAETEYFEALQEEAHKRYRAYMQGRLDPEEVFALYETEIRNLRRALSAGERRE